MFLVTQRRGLARVGREGARASTTAGGAADGGDGGMTELKGNASDYEYQQNSELRNVLRRLLPETAARKTLKWETGALLMK